MVDSITLFFEQKFFFLIKNANSSFIMSLVKHQENILIIGRHHDLVLFGRQSEEFDIVAWIHILKRSKIQYEMETLLNLRKGLPVIILELISAVCRQILNNLKKLSCQRWSSQSCLRQLGSWHRWRSCFASNHWNVLRNPMPLFSVRNWLFNFLKLIWFTSWLLVYTFWNSGVLMFFSQFSHTEKMEQVWRQSQFFS